MFRFMPRNEVDQNYEKEEFYEAFQDLVANMPNHDNQLVLGDLNGHIRPRTQLLKNIIGPFSIGDVNNDWERTIDFYVRNGMSIMNTFFQHRPSHKLTWYK